MKRCLAVVMVVWTSFSVIGCGRAVAPTGTAPDVDGGNYATGDGVSMDAAEDDEPVAAVASNEKVRPEDVPDTFGVPDVTTTTRTHSPPLPTKTLDPSTDLQAQAARDGFFLQRVYYGTDRKPTESQAQRWQTFRSHCWKTGGAGLVTLVFGLVFLSSRRKIWSVFAALGLVVTLLLGAMTLREKDKVDQDVRNNNRVYLAEPNEGERELQIERGVCFVSIPKVHVQGSGEFERPDLTDLKVDRSRHFDLPEVRLIENRQKFLDYVSADVKASKQKQALVFIHGYNVTFEAAAMRTAQLAYDLRFDGPAAFFSWPSSGTTTGYASDEDSVDLTVPQMKTFLTDLIKDTGAESVHVIAHSMGNRALSDMLVSLERVQNSDGLPVLSQVIMAAPDVNATKFRTTILKHIKDAARNFTLYASSKDIALFSSEVLRKSNYTRLGQGGNDRQVLPDIQTIDASDLPGDAIFKLGLGHSYYVHPAVMRDLRYLMETPKPAQQRTWLKKQPHQPSGSYWTFKDAASGEP